MRENVNNMAEPKEQRVRRGRLRTQVVIAAVFALVAAACGGSSDGAGSASGDSDSASAAEASAGGDSGSGSDSDGGDDGSMSGSGDYVVALSNSFIGNDWRTTMVDSFEAAAQAAVDAGDIAEFRIENTAANTATEQIASIENLILAGVDAIVINSASPTALDPVIQDACDQGIVVVVFDSLADAPCAYKVANDFEEWGRTQAQLVLEGMGGKGNLIVVEGVVGSAPNETVLKVWAEELAKYPDVEVVAEVIGQNDGAITQQALVPVLPSLGDVDGVLLQVGANGVINAFTDAGRDLPIVDLDTHGGTLQLWKDLNESTGFETSAVLTDPGQGSAALQVAILLLHGEKVDGKDIPMELTMPLVVIRQEDLDGWLAVTPPTAMAGWTWTKAQIIDAIAANIAGDPVPAPGIPSS